MFERIKFVLQPIVLSLRLGGRYPGNQMASTEKN